MSFCTRVYLPVYQVLIEAFPDDNPRDFAVFYSSIGAAVATSCSRYGCFSLLLHQKIPSPNQRPKGGRRTVATLLKKLSKKFMLSGDQLIATYANFTIDYERERGPTRTVYLASIIVTTT